ncbi:hypothetical protein GC163_12100 [bacterium]|nr:hypothetical protein [bacterium]
MSRCLALGCLVAWMLWSDMSVTEATAAVRGNSYDVIVEEVPTGTFDDVYTFRTGGGFVSDRGGVGTWKELNLIVFSVWTSTFTDGRTYITLTGVQVGSSLNGVGSNQNGHTFTVTGTKVAP